MGRTEKKRPRSPSPPPPLPTDDGGSGSRSSSSRGTGVAGCDGGSTPKPPLAGRARRRHKQQQQLEVHIVEDHGDALEHLYDAIGAKRAPFARLRWVHLDSHPDLTLPSSLTPATVMDPPALYEALDASPGGNAEFILPAVFAGHVDEVWWVKPPWATQLPDGERAFHVGVEARSGCLRVTCPDIYYLDEGLYCPQGDMDPQHPCRLLRLKVCSAQELMPDPITTSSTSSNNDSTASSTTSAAAAPAPAPPRAETQGVEGWILDVCLDYYTTRNPFLDAVDEALSGLGWGEGEVEAARGVVQRYFGGPRFRGGQGEGVDVEGVRAELAAFSRLTSRLLDRAATASPLTDTESTALAALFPSSPTTAAAAASETIEAFATLLRQGGQLVVAAVRAMGAHCACLPAHASGWSEVEGMLQETGALVGRLCREFGRPPSIVLVARSARDGYTPPELVDAIQERLLVGLEGVPELMAGSGGKSGLKVSKHYEEEEEEEGVEEGQGEK